jgi:hypothetical protein
MKVTKDVFECIAERADPCTALNMFSVNKKFLNEEYYKRIIEKKYRYLINLKDKKIEYKYSQNSKRTTVIFDYNLSWRQIFIKNSYYLRKLEEKYEIPYFHKFFPEKLWTYLNKEKNPFERLFYHALLRRKRDIVKIFITKNLVSLEKCWIYTACSSGDLVLVKEMYEYSKNDIQFDIRVAVCRSYDVDILKFLKDKGATKEDLNECLVRGGKYVETLKFLIQNGADKIDEAITEYNRIKNSYLNNRVSREDEDGKLEKLSEERIKLCVTRLEESISYLQSCKR